MLPLFAMLQLTISPPERTSEHDWVLAWDTKQQRVWIDSNAPDIGGGVREIWMKAQLHNAPSGTYTISTSLMDCKNARWRDVQQTYYEHDLRTDSEKPLRDWDNVPEKGFIRQMFDTLCSGH